MRVFVVEKYKDKQLDKECDFGEILTVGLDRAKTLHKSGVAIIIDDSELEKALAKK